MGEKEDNVYKAKLAEQAERYEGMILSIDAVVNCFWRRRRLAYYAHVLSSNCTLLVCLEHITITFFSDSLAV